MALAVFDLDDTLIDGNSPSLWGEYLGELGWLDRDVFMAHEQHLVREYAAERLTLEAYLAFTLQPLIGRTLQEVREVAEAFVAAKIEPLIFEDARRCVAEHRAAGDRLLVLSASPRFLVQAAAALLDLEHAVGVELEERDGRLTGATRGILSYREGKIAALADWRIRHGVAAGETHFYSDSRNDLPLLQAVDHPHAINPDDVLRAHAEAQGWDIQRWR